MKQTNGSVFIYMALIALAGCGQHQGEQEPAASSPVSNASASQPTDDATADSMAMDEDVRLLDRIPDPDANEPLVSVEDGPSAVEDASDVLQDSQTEIVFVPVPTTSLRAAAEQVDLAFKVDRHNRDVRWGRLAYDTGAVGSSEPNATTQAATPPPAPPAAPAPASAQAPAQKVETKPAVIDEQKIVRDAQGQWASTAKASSTYAQSPGDKAGYSAWQATGAPNVSSYSDNPASWTTKSGDAKDPEWLELGFAKTVHATSLRIRQSAAPGAISKIELIDDRDALHEIWSGTDDTVYEKNKIGWFIRDVPRTTYLVKGARITLQTARVWGWNEIDAVQLIGTP